MSKIILPGAIARPVQAPIGAVDPRQIPLEHLAQALMIQGVRAELQTGWQGRLVTIEARCGSRTGSRSSRPRA